ncbi:thiamine diphosphate-binding protein [Collybia nuda]|uniref:Thiamine diphosphate-binding protein n=1 Tax=Collybia nuda TaxID=64659 RepID=A0A9P6CHH3_9AGAR|nr:thiamine diphosphate-binding protein [Collybia nuda]
MIQCPTSDDSTFPIPFIKNYKPVVLDPSQVQLTPEQRSALSSNIQLWRDALILFTASGHARGVAGHTGGPFDSVVELCILLGILAGDPEGKKFVHTLFDEAGHRVPLQYLLAAFRGRIPASKLLTYRAAYSGLPGHPEFGLPSADFSSGRLGHMWPFVNGITHSEKKTVFCLGSDGAQQEGNDVEAARLAVNMKLNVKLIIDDNNMTVVGPSRDILPHFDITKTLTAEGMAVFEADGENIDNAYAAIARAIQYDGPAAAILHRPICPGIDELQGSNHGHDAICASHATSYLQKRGYGEDITSILMDMKPTKESHVYKGSSEELTGNRYLFGKAVNECLGVLPEGEAQRRVFVIDSDLMLSTGLAAIKEAHPEVFHSSGIMERANISAAAGFGFNNDKQGIFATFTAFSEMCLSELTMARMNNSNLLCHFSHSGCDDMADNTCHFGVNGFFLDNGLPESFETKLYFPADGAQMMAVVKRIFWDKGLRTIFSTRSKVPYILKENSTERFYDNPDYIFVPGKDEVIREGTVGTVVSYGEMLYRALDAVTTLREEGIDVGLVNKVTLNTIDEESLKAIGKKGFVLIVEAWNQKTGLGSKMGTWLLERGYCIRYAYMGVRHEGCGGLWEQIHHQGLDPESIEERIRSLLK